MATGLLDMQDFWSRNVQRWQTGGRVQGRLSYVAPSPENFLVVGATGHLYVRDDDNADRIVDNHSSACLFGKHRLSHRSILYLPFTSSSCSAAYAGWELRGEKECVMALLCGEHRDHYIRMDEKFYVAVLSSGKCIAFCERALNSIPKNDRHAEQIPDGIDVHIGSSKPALDGRSEYASLSDLEWGDRLFSMDWRVLFRRLRKVALWLFS